MLPEVAPPAAAEVVANLAHDLVAEGSPLRAGQCVASGAVAPPAPALPGTVNADLAEFGSVQGSFVIA